MNSLPLNKVNISGTIKDTNKIIKNKYRLIEIQTKSLNSYIDVEVLILNKEIESFLEQNTKYIEIKGSFVSSSRIIAEEFKILNEFGEVQSQKIIETQKE